MAFKLTAKEKWTFEHSAKKVETDESTIYIRAMK
jgi:hypothetical protein